MYLFNVTLLESGVGTTNIYILANSIQQVIDYVSTIPNNEILNIERTSSTVTILN